MLHKMPVNTPSEVSDPIATIAAAENEASSLDILVCGNCQSVFHFVEEFQEHKTKNDCEKADKASLNLQGSKKPQVWAFLIWKNSQQKVADQQGSWKLYQRWCNMPESQRQSWVTAGRNIQAFINLSHARELNKVDLNNKENMERDLDDEMEEDFVVEKIVGKRYNHKKRQVEYLLKWEGYPPEQNTWEPLSNLTTCKTLLQEYERLAAQQSNDKSLLSSSSTSTSTSRLSGVLKRDLGTPIKLANAATSSATLANSKPTGIIPNKYSYAADNKKPDTPTLQTQRKIVPATPLSNSSFATLKQQQQALTTSAAAAATLITPKSSSILSVDLTKSASSLSADDNVERKSSSDSPGSDLRQPLKKRMLHNANAEETSNEKSPVKIIKQKIGGGGDSWEPAINDSDFDTPSLKRIGDTDDELAEDNAKRQKLLDGADDSLKSTDGSAAEGPRSGIFKKSDLKERFPSINSMFGKDSGSRNSKSSPDQKGVLKIDHTQIPELQSGIYKMSVKGGVVKIESVIGERTISAALPTMPGPKGGVLILGTRFDLSRVSRGTPKQTAATGISAATILSPEKSGGGGLVLKTATAASIEHQSPAFRGIFPKGKVLDDGKLIAKPDFHAKSFSVAVADTNSAAKKVVGGSAIRKVLGPTLSTAAAARGRTRTSIGNQSGIARLKSGFGKGFADGMDTSGARLMDSDGFLMEFCDYDNSDMEEYSFPDDFPQELDLEPLSPSRPLTLDPETGKRLMRAEGEPTPLPTPEPSPEPSPVPSPVKMICKEEKENMANGNLILKAGDDDNVEGETYTEINGNTYKVTNASHVGLLQNAAYSQGEAELKGISVPSELTEEEGNGSNMITITGEDGLVYQVANAKLEGDTIVVASGDDDQQCVFVTEDGHQVMQRTNEDGSTVLTLESAYADAVAQLVPNQVNILPDGSQIYVKQEENGQVELVQIQGGTEIAEQEGGEEVEGQLAENADDNSGQVVAQLIEAGEPAPGGGPRRVVLLLPDGNLMVTEVDEEQFAALELEK